MWLTLFGGIGRAAHAQDAQSTLLAKRAFDRGTEASKAGHWLEARAQFKRSVGYVAKPSALFNLALADIMLGLGGEAEEALGAFAQLARAPEHADMLARLPTLRSLAKALNERARESSASAELVAVEGLAPEVMRLVADAVEAYQQGDMKRALVLFERAYEQSHRPELLYDIGLTADRLAASERARLAYQAFIAALPEAPEAAAARARLMLLPTAQAGAGERVPSPLAAAGPSAHEPAREEPATRPVPGSAPRALRPALLLGSAAALALGAVGGAFWWRDRSQTLDHCLHPATAEGLCFPHRRRIITRQYRASIATTSALVGLSIAVLAWGILDWLHNARRGAHEGLRLEGARARISRHGSWFGAELRF